MESQDRWLNEREVARYTGISLSSLRNSRWQKSGLPYAKAGKSVRYRWSTVEAYMTSREVAVRDTG